MNGLGREGMPRADVPESFTRHQTRTEIGLSAAQWRTAATRLHGRVQMDLDLSSTSCAPECRLDLGLVSGAKSKPRRHRKLTTVTSISSSPSSAIAHVMRRKMDLVLHFRGLADPRLSSSVNGHSPPDAANVGYRKMLIQCIEARGSAQMWFQAGCAKQRDG
jgi:hypothetical protein